MAKASESSSDAGAPDQGEAALRRIGSGYEVRRVGRPMGVWVRAGVLAAGFAVTCVGAMVVGEQVEGVVEGGRVLVLPVGIVVGLLFAMGLIVAPELKARDEREKLERRIRNAATATRDEPISALLDVDEKNALYGIARALHDALMDGHRDRLEAARLRKDMAWRVDQKTRKQTLRYAKEAETDELTGLLNRRGFARRLEEVIEASRKTNGMSDVALMAIDLDRFKQLNDTYGHERGDEALVAVGEVLAAHTRDADFAARLGGDEFIMAMMPSTNLSASHVGERLIKLFESLGSGRDVGEMWPSMSIGIAALHEDKARDGDELCRWADEALYASKRAGRCRVMTHQDVRRGGKRVA